MHIYLSNACGRFPIVGMLVSETVHIFFLSFSESFPPSMLATNRRFVADDLFRFNSINLDPLTETVSDFILLIFSLRIVVVILQFVLCSVIAPILTVQHAVLLPIPCDLAELLYG